MDGLWDPPNYQETEDTHCEIDGCQCAYCLTTDVEEETALNELSCIEVLRILISKSDADIIELEEELMDLLFQLVYTDKEFSDMFSVSLRKEIDCLNRSIKKLKDDKGDDLSTSRKPAESMLDILKSLFSLYIQKKDKQKSADSINNAASSSCQEHTDTPFKKKKQTTSSSNATQMEKNERTMNTSLEKHKISQIRVKMEQDDTDYPYINLYQGPIEKWSNQLIKVKCQPDEESVGSKSTPSIESTNTQIKNSNRNLNPENLQEQNVPLSQSSKKTYKRRQTLNPPLQRRSTSPCLLLLEGADMANGADMASEIDMDCFTVDELRTMARERNLKGVSKLRKVKLAQLLGIKISEGKRKLKRKETLALTLT